VCKGAGVAPPFSGGNSVAAFEGFRESRGIGVTGFVRDPFQRPVGLLQQIGGRSDFESFQIIFWGCLKMDLKQAVEITAAEPAVLSDLIHVAYPGKVFVQVEKALFGEFMFRILKFFRLNMFHSDGFKEKPGKGIGTFNPAFWILTQKVKNNIG
jgi:hypothetical protein